MKKTFIFLLLTVSCYYAKSQKIIRIQAINSYYELDSTIHFQFTNTSSCELLYSVALEAFNEGDWREVFSDIYHTQSTITMMQCLNPHKTEKRPINIKKMMRPYLNDIVGNHFVYSSNFRLKISYHFGKIKQETYSNNFRIGN